MKSMRVYHHNFESAGTKTIFLAEKPHSLLVKNMTSDIIKFSWGKEIDTTAYSELPTLTAELFEYDAIPSEDLYITVQATGTGKIEARIIDD